MPRHCSAAGCLHPRPRETRQQRDLLPQAAQKGQPPSGTVVGEQPAEGRERGGPLDPASKYIYFCSQHFEKSCFEIVGFSGYHRLKEGAVPPSLSPPPQTPPDH
eukprot:XP_025001851.1 THAP domain-containing protein 7-like [Gallus gallus]